MANNNMAGEDSAAAHDDLYHMMTRFVGAPRNVELTSSLRRNTNESTHSMRAPTSRDVAPLLSSTHDVSSICDTDADSLDEINLSNSLSALAKSGDVGEEYEDGYHAAERFASAMDSKLMRWRSRKPKSGAECLSERWGVPWNSPSPPSVLAATTTAAATTSHSGSLSDPGAGFLSCITSVKRDMEHLRALPPFRSRTVERSTCGGLPNPSEDDGKGMHCSTNCTEATSSHRSMTGLSLRENADNGYLETLKTLQIADVFDNLVRRERQGDVLHESDADLWLLPMTVIKFRLRYAKRVHHYRVEKMTVRFPTPCIPKDLPVV